MEVITSTQILRESQFNIEPSSNSWLYTRIPHIRYKISILWPILSLPTLASQKSSQTSQACKNKTSVKLEIMLGSQKQTNTYSACHCECPLKTFLHFRISNSKFLKTYWLLMFTKTLVSLALGQGCIPSVIAINSIIGISNSNAVPLAFELEMPIIAWDIFRT